jgi:hypothetical protein
MGWHAEHVHHTELGGYDTQALVKHSEMQRTIFGKEVVKFK